MSNDDDIAKAMTTAQVKYAKLLAIKGDAANGVAAAKVTIVEAEETFASAERRSIATQKKSVETAKEKLDQTNTEQSQKISEWQTKVEVSESELNTFLAEMKDGPLNIDLNFLVREPTGNRGRTVL